MPTWTEPTVSVVCVTLRADFFHAGLDDVAEEKPDDDHHGRDDHHQADADADNDFLFHNAGKLPPVRRVGKKENRRPSQPFLIMVRTASTSLFTS